MDLIEKSRGFWLEASEHFDFVIFSPIDVVSLGYPSSKVVFAYLPQYGSENGMILHYLDPSNMTIDSEISDIAKRMDLFISFFNPHVYSNYKSEIAKEALNDWHRFNP